MKIEKIDVKTSNKKHATDIAMLVDKLEFLKEINRLREKWRVPEPNKDSDLYRFLELTVKEKDRLDEFNSDIEMLLKQFNRGKNFKSVVEHALITGVIPDNIYQSCYFDIVTIGEAEDLNKPERYQYVIVMSPRTEKQEVAQAYREFQEHIKGYKATNKNENNVLGKIDFQNSENGFNWEVPDDKELIKQYHKGNIYKSADIAKFKTQKELDRAREWHWIRYDDYLNGKSNNPLTPAEVCTEWQNKCSINRNLKFKELKDCSCIYCIDPVLIMKSLKKYDNLLEHS